MRTFAALMLAGALLAAAACSGDGEEGTTEVSPQPDTTEPGGFTLTGGDVAEGEPIDPLHTCDGTNISPALAWDGVPEGTVELALILDDPDAPGGTFTHWVVYAIPPDYTGLERGVPPGPVVSGALSLRQGLNDGSDVPGYTGPCPPEGEHGYVFALSALDQATDLEGGATVDDLRAAMEGHVLAEAVLTAPYSRPSR
ncbi:MAG TPA: YbhB/YbcL family Raf kinase inhibitor-like protein [Gaiellaceae bacterium]|nr:YbhB/YbcL family Raf kinase inhibitor-like protein [Gaiellaceae bacterium]